MPAPSVRKRQIIAAIMKEIHMSDKEMTSAQSAPSEDVPGDTSKDTLATDQPATQPDKTPAEVGPAPKS